MGFKKYESSGSFVVTTQLWFIAVVSTVICFGLEGCSDQIRLPSTEQLYEFENAGPVRPSVDMSRLVRARIGGGPYRVVQGDVLELVMPAVLQIVTAADAGGPEQTVPYVCRVSDNGNISLPVVGDVEASGRTLAQIEAAVIDAYYPEYAVTRPSVFVRVLEYDTAKVSVTGAVEKPGIYSLRSDQMSLVAVLMEAGGIIDDGAARIRIIHQNAVSADHERPVRKAVSPQKRAGSVEKLADQIDVQLRFRQSFASRPVGEMTVCDRNNKILLIQQLDVSQESDRQVLLRNLAAKEPGISISEMEGRLRSLAETLQGGSSVPSVARDIADKESMSQGNASTTASLVLAATEVGPWQARQTPIAEYGISRQPALGVSADIEQEVGTNQSGEAESIVLPVKGFNIPFADVVLQDGDSVIVERLQPPLFTVMGLVRSPGNFPYPPEIRYNLAQALAFAGGLNEVADPRYVSIYRLRADGTITSAVFEIMNDSKLTEASSTLIKPGDIVAVEHTPRTRTAVFLDRIFRVNIGTYWSMNDLWD